MDVLYQLSSHQLNNGIKNLEKASVGQHSKIPPPCEATYVGESK